MLTDRHRSPLSIAFSLLALAPAWAVLVVGCTSPKSDAPVDLQLPAGAYGSLGKPCARDENCDPAGVCLPLSDGTAVCSIGCADSDSCPPGWICDVLPSTSSVVCQCQPGTESCNGIDDDCNGFVDEPAPANADCINRFGARSTCQAGKCNCATTICDMRCVETSSDPTNCGGCGKACAAGAACERSECKCPAGQVVCGERCVDTRISSMHCGACDKPCPAGSACAAGACACPNQKKVCGDTCADIMADVRHCGDCGVVCVMGASCLTGACACPRNTAACRGACVDVQQSASDCGGCGIACGAGERCSNGACICLSPALTRCNGGCADLSTDPDNCKDCGKKCSPPHAVPVCRSGVCGVQSCVAPFLDCDRDPANGCEVDPAGDAGNCGQCGQRCASGTCKMGVCGPIVLAAGQAVPTSLVTDGSAAANASTIFWTTRGMGMAADVVVSFDLANKTRTVLASAQNAPDSLVIEGRSLFWFAGDAVPPTRRTLMRAGTDGANAKALCVVGGASGAMASDGASLFWGDEVSRGRFNISTMLVTAEQCDKRPVSVAMGAPDGGAPDAGASDGGMVDPNRVPVEPASAIVRLLASDDALYWIEPAIGGNLLNYYDSKRMFTARLVPDVLYMDLDESFLYYSTRNSIKQALRDGKNPGDLENTMSAPRLVTDGALVFFHYVGKDGIGGDLHLLQKVSTVVMGPPPPPVTVTVSPGPINLMAIDRGNIYFTTTTGGVYMVPK